MNFDKTQAACRGIDPDLFYPERGDNDAVRQAKELCRTCPVIGPCLGWALLHEEEGVWGGTSANSRRGLRTQLGIRLESPDVALRYQGCGTNGGYSQHLRRGETPCTRCRQAHAGHSHWAEDRRRYKASASCWDAEDRQKIRLRAHEDSGS